MLGTSSVLLALSCGSLGRRVLVWWCSPGQRPRAAIFHWASWIATEAYGFKKGVFWRKRRLFWLLHAMLLSKHRMYIMISYWEELVW